MRAFARAVRRGATRLALVVGAVLLALLVVEGGLRLVLPKPAISWDYLVTSDDHVADARTIVVRRALLDEETYRTPEAVLCVAALGDSFTLGYPVERGASYPAVLERILSGPGHPARVVNLGMGNSGPDQHLRLFEEVVLPRWRPDVVVWALYANDLGDDVRLPTYEVRDGALRPLDVTRHWVYRRQRLFERLPLPGWVKRRSWIVRLGLQAWEAANRPAAEVAEADWRRSEAKVRLAVERMRALGREKGFDVIVASIRPQAAYLAEADPEAWSDARPLREHRRLEAVLRAAGPVLDIASPAEGPPPLFGIFRDESHRGRKLRGGYHFDETGYRRMAETVAAELLRRLSLGQ